MSLNLFKYPKTINMEEKQMASDNFFEIIDETEKVETTILIKKKTVRPISGGRILKTSEKGVTVNVSDGDVLRIDEYIYVWRGAKHELEIKC